MLETRLRSHIDSIADPVDISEVLGREPEWHSEDDLGHDAVVRVPEVELLDAATHRPGGDWRPALAAAALVVVIALAGLIAAALRDDSASTLLADPEARALPKLPANLAEATWEKIVEPFPPRDPANAVMVAGATQIDGSAWAVGFEWRIVFEDNVAQARKRGAIWRSTDGKNWEVIDHDFGSLDDPAGRIVPSGVSFSHIVSTSDGALWVFGSEFRDGVVPVGYRTTDGETWSPIELPVIDDEMTQLESAIAHGRDAVVTLTDVSEFPGLTQVLSSTDGASWNVLAEGSGGSIAVDGSVGDELLILSNDALGLADGAHLRVAASDAGFVAASTTTGEEFQVIDGQLVETVEEGSPNTSSALVWHSNDGADWNIIDRVFTENSFGLTPVLEAHADGVLVAIEWVGEPETGVALIDIDGNSGDVRELGELPSGTMTDMFILNNQLFVLGSQLSAALEDNEQDSSLWVSDFSDAVADDEPIESSSSSEEFDECLEVLETPEQAGLEISLGSDGEVLVGGRDEFDPRVTLCANTINERVEAALTGSSTGRDGPISPEQTDALRDGVTEEELEQAFRRFVDCIERSGGTITRTFSPEYAYIYEAPHGFAHDVCEAWNFRRISIIANPTEGETGRSATLEKLTRSAAEVRALLPTEADDWTAELSVEAAGQDCDVLGNGAWITISEFMTQPLCMVVGAEHALNVVNKGSQTATIDWGGTQRTLAPATISTLGPLGDSMPAGKHEVDIEPFGSITFYVMPRAVSFIAQLELELFLNDSTVQGLTSSEFEKVLGVELAIDDRYQASSSCVIAVIPEDPYSPSFRFVGDRTIEGGVLAEVVRSDTYRCD